MRGQHAEFTLPIEDASPVPRGSRFRRDQLSCDRWPADLKKLIRRTIFATDLESARYALGGVLVELTAESIAMVGTDGRRLARMVAPAEAENDPPAPTGTPVIPVKALKLIERNLVDDDSLVHLAIQAGTAVLVRTESAVIYSRLVEGPVPPLPGRLPGQRRGQDPPRSRPAAAGRRAGVDRHQRREPGRRFPVRPRGAQAVQPGGRRGQLARRPADRLRRARPSRSPSTPATWSTRSRPWTMRPPVTAELIDAKNAAVFKTDDQYTYVVMPLTRER